MANVEIPTLKEIKAAMKQVLEESLPGGIKEQQQEKLLTKKEVSEVLNVSQSTIDNLRRQGSMKSIKIPGGGVRFRPQDINEFLNNQNK